MKSNVEILDGAVEELVDPDTRLERLAGGFSWAEGPVWNFEEGYLTFSDVIGNAIHRYDETGGVRIYRRPSDHANGQTRDAGGRLVVCEHRTRRLTREVPEGVEPVVESYDGKMFNSPNDVVAAKDGTLIFTDPAYGLDKVEEGGAANGNCPSRVSTASRPAPTRRSFSRTTSSDPTAWLSRRRRIYSTSSTRSAPTSGFSRWAPGGSCPAGRCWRRYRRGPERRMG